jgi:hypothetical protein
MPPYTYQTRPVTADIDGDDGYRQLIIAVVQRAIADACGHVHMRGADKSGDRLEAEAKLWLAGRGAEEWLALADYDPELILPQVRRRVLGG